MVRKKIILITLVVSISLIIIWCLLSMLILPLMWNYLVVDETLHSSDVIIVPSGDKGRVEYGIELYEQGYAPFILFSGGAARSMKSTALSRGVAEEHILLDSKSSTTYENASNSADIMRAHDLQSAIIVTSAYHTKRASIIFSQHIPRDHLTICKVPGGSSANNWWKDKHSSRAVILEYAKLTYHFLLKR